MPDFVPAPHSLSSAIQSLDAFSKAPKGEGRFLTIDDLNHLPNPVWAVEGLFEVNSLTMLAGPPGSMKSFLALDWMLCMASGRKWMGRPTVASKVLYVLGEGKASLLKRIQAWTFYNRLDKVEMARLNDNFKVTFEVPQMAMRGSVDNMLAALSREGYAPTLIVIDTFARSLVGLDENAQKDTGMWVENADRLRQLGYTMVFLHHTAKNTEFGLKYRGSSAIMGALDTAMTLSKGDGGKVLTLKVVKQKDHDEGDPLYFNKLVVNPKAGEEGSVVLIPSAAPFLDERFKEDKPTVLLRSLLEDASFESDRARGRELARQLGIAESAGVSRVNRARDKDFELGAKVIQSA